MSKKLCKSEKNKMIFGVCGGIAEYFNVDVTLVRIIAVLLCLFSIGTGVIVYLIIALIMPKQSLDSYSDETVDNLKRANVEPEDSEAEKSSEKARSDDDFNSHFKK